MGTLRGAVTAEITDAKGKKVALTLYLGFTALEVIVAKYGKHFLDDLQEPDGLPIGLVLDLVREGLKRYHADDLLADPYLADDVIAQCSGVLEAMIASAFPDVEPAPGNRKAARKVRGSTSPRG